MLTKEVIRDHQYKTSINLESRITLHQRFTRYNSDFWPWIANHYPWDASQKILEVGCGTGVFWDSAAKLVRADAEVLLTDISPGMLEKTKSRIRDPRFSFALLDVDQPDLEMISMI